MSQKKKDLLIEFNRNNILEAARILFLQRGVEGTSMDDIAKSAEYSKSTIYVYFKSKDEIYYTIVYEYMVLLQAGMRQCIEQEIQIEACYLKICNMLVDFQAKYPMYFECILGKISINQKDFEKLPILAQIYEVGEEINQCVVSFLERGIASNEIGPQICLLATVFVLWSNIGSLIATAANKREYIESHMGMTYEEFLKHGFMIVFESIRKQVHV